MNYFKELPVDIQRKVNSIARGEDRFYIQGIINDAYEAGKGVAEPERETTPKLTKGKAVMGGTPFNPKNPGYYGQQQEEPDDK